MNKNALRFFLLLVLNLLVLYRSIEIDVDQLLKDINFIFRLETINRDFIFLFISVSISFLTILLLYFFRPFSEIYLTHYLKSSYYLMINLVSISTVYLVFRIYGYSRLYIFMYLLLGVLSFQTLDKFLK